MPDLTPLSPADEACCKWLIELQAMLDQAMQAAETLRDCWLERTGLTIEDDPFVEDACSTIQSIRSELLRSEP